ncbi:hypothetical protein AVEN_234482-1 [Araneus ventricosus]|uniref:Uncharacterized protein n=1 Tax=Araneus ventricosus TaxID=182803 RepID=A0A4Y2A939_ARAVE|nr:hypothetical protein AVEN_234482-1 [Araneus ventricosus]
MRDSISSTLEGTGAPAGAGRRKRDLCLKMDDEAEAKAERVLQMLWEAVDKYKSTVKKPEGNVTQNTGASSDFSHSTPMLL